MAEFTIKTAAEKKRFQGSKGGEFVVYNVTFQDGQTAEWVKKAESKAPVEGEKVEGALEPTQYGAKFKPAQAAFGGKGGGKSPAEKAEIARMHSQEMAIRWVHVLQMRGKVPDDADTDFLKRLIDFFQKDAKAAGARA